MAFGQQSGPPATARQVQELVALLHEAGHVDFRDARGPMGFTQRQAGGKFTRDEAEAFISRLQEAGPAPDEPVVRQRAPRPTAPAPFVCCGSPTSSWPPSFADGVGRSPSPKPSGRRHRSGQPGQVCSRTSLANRAAS